jgi:molybdenum cofactor cytidylyltransferase
MVGLEPAIFALVVPASMKFGPIPLAEARGAILAHTQKLGDRTLRKGTLLDADAVMLLRDAGHSEIIAVRLDPGDVPEDIAADRLAEPLISPLLSRTRAATGRVNLAADVPGVFRVNAAKINRINSVGEAITLGTLPDFSVVAARDLVATIKIIPFAVPGSLLLVAEAVARQGGPALVVHPFRPLKVGMVATQLPGIKEPVIEKTISVTQERVTRLTGSLLETLRTPHEQPAVTAALHRLMDQGADLLLVVGASAVVDRRDVGPAAIVQAGGEILHFGMPVDPGNLICLGRVGQRPALVLPGCARSPRPNGIDFILPRLFAGVPVTPADIMALGVGGLLAEAEARGLPRDKAPAVERSGPAPRSAPNIAAVVLAAGRSRRMAPHNKLLIADRTGKPIIARVVDNVLSSKARPILIVTGHQPREIEQAVGGRPVRYVHASDYAEGLAASLKAGIAAVPPEAAAAIVCLGDMPLVTGRMIDRLLEAYDPQHGRLIVMPTFRGKQGNPMIWDTRFFPEIMEISGDSGARFLVGKHADVLAEVEMADDAVVRDFDTPESLATLPQRLRPDPLPAS